MNRLILCLSIVALLLPGCRKRKPTPADAPAADAATAASAGGAPTETSSSGTPKAQASVPTLKGIAPNSDNPMAKALAGNDPQAHLRVLNELVMAYDQSQGKPLTTPEELVKVGLLSRLPAAPLGMKFSYNPNKRLIELVAAR
jgi:hypothetical protein